MGLGYHRFAHGGGIDSNIDALAQSKETLAIAQNKLEVLTHLSLMRSQLEYIYILADIRTRSKHGHKPHKTVTNTNNYTYSFLSWTISQWNVLPKILVDRENVDNFKHVLKDLHQHLYFNKSFCGVIYSDSDSDSVHVTVCHSTGMSTVLYVYYDIQHPRFS